MSSRPLILALSALLTPWLTAGCYMVPPGDDKDVLDSRAREVPACDSPVDEQLLADQLWQLINLERTGAGVAPVALSEALTSVAADYACEMIRRGFFGHYDPESGDGPGRRAMAERYLFYSIGENLAAGQQTPVEVMRVWLSSPSHREIILDPRWKEVGVAVRSGGEYGLYWVQEFADPAPIEALTVASATSGL